VELLATQTKGKIMTTTNKELYAGTFGGEVLCENCAGVTLKASIRNARKGQRNFEGLNGEAFEIFEDAEQYGLDCEGEC
jgi:hypothetical protein